VEKLFMAESVKPSFYDAARAYDIMLGPVRIQKPAGMPEGIKCADAVMDAYQMVGNEARLLGEIKALSCNNPTAVSTTVDAFAVKHNLKKRTDLDSCPALTANIDPTAKSLLTSKGWTVSEHMIKSPTGMIISFIDTAPNQSVSIVKLSASEVMITTQECTGNTMRAKINVDTLEINVLP
jgi:hypothetical protein